MQQRLEETTARTDILTHITHKRYLQNMSMFLFLLQSALYLLRGTDATNYQNVYGEKLQSCSYDRMALTGFTRNGYCVDENDDQGM